MSGLGRQTIETNPVMDRLRNGQAAGGSWLSLCSPVAAGVLLLAGAGGGRSADAIRPTVASVLDLPLPVDVDAWRAGAVALRHGDLARFTLAMAAAYDREPGALEAWWTHRLPAPPPPAA